MKRRLLIIAMWLLSQPLIADVKERLVSIDGSITEIIYALKKEDYLVAVDTTSLYPQEVTTLPNVGYMRALSTEGILSVKPTLVLASQSAGPIKVMEQLKLANVDVEIIANEYSIKGVKHKINAIAKILNADRKAQMLISDFDSAMSKPLSIVKSHSALTPRILCFLGMQGNQMMAAGINTQADAIINLMGGKNAIETFAGYRPLNKEAVINFDADAIIIFNHQPEEENKLKDQFKYSRAALNDKVIVAASSELLGFGLRLPQALSDVVNKLYITK